MREERDPIDGLRKVLLDNGYADEDAIKEIDRDVKAIVNEAATFAQESPEPAEAELWTDVYA